LLSLIPQPPIATLFPYTTLFRSEDTYKNKDGFSYWSNSCDGQQKSKEPELQILEDDYRRKEQFGSLIKGKTWLDFGCGAGGLLRDRKSTRLNSSHVKISYAVFCL